MTEQQWTDLLEENYNTKADTLLAQGYEVITDKPYKIYQNDQGNKVYLARQLGSPEWYFVGIEND